MERIISQDFKETEIGPIPKEWEVVRLGDINQSIKSSLIPSDFPDEDFEYYSIPAYQDNKKPSIQKGSSILSLKLVLQNDTVLFGKLNPRVEKVWVVSSESPLRKIGSTEWLPIIPNKHKAISSFLYFLEFSNYVMPKAKELVSGSTPSRQRVDPTSFYKISIPLPPLSEQTAIANILFTVQENIKKTEAVINSTNELKKSLMNHLFTYGPVSINGAEKIKLKETEVGLIPEEWNVVRLGDLFEIQQGITLCREPSPDKFLKPFLRTSNVFWGKIDLSNLDSMYFSEKQLQSLTLKSKDLLICEGGDIGRTAMWNEQIAECCHQNHLHRLRAKNDLETLPEFYMYWMQFGMLIRGLYSEEGNKTTIPNLSRSRLSNFLIPLPPLPIQKQIADILSAVDMKIEAEENKAKALEKLFQSLLNDLMTGKIRVREEVA